MKTITKQELKDDLTPKRIVFFDIDGVLTPSPKFVPGESPKITKTSIKVLKEFDKKDLKSLQVLKVGGIKKESSKRQSFG